MTDPETFMLETANKILTALHQNFTLDEEDYLYSDEFYITIVSSIVPDNLMNLKPGETEEERAENMDKLVEFLTTIVEVDLSHITGSSIVYKRDSASANNLLELIFELIQILKQDQEEKQDLSQKAIDLPEEEINFKNSNENDGPENFNESGNINFRNNISCPQVEFENDNDSNFKQNYSQNDLTRYEKVMTYLVNNQDDIIQQDQNEVNEDYFQNIENPADQVEQSKSVNISRISEVSKSKENSEPHSNNKLFKQILNTSKNQERKSESNTMKPLNTSQHKITSLDEDSEKYSSEIKQNYKTESEKFEQDDFAYENSHETEEDISKSLHENEQSLQMKNKKMSMNNTGKLSSSSVQNKNFFNTSNRSSNPSESRYKQQVNLSKTQKERPKTNIEIKRIPSAKKLRKDQSNSFQTSNQKNENSNFVNKANYSLNSSNTNKQEDRVLKKNKSVKQLITKQTRPKSAYSNRSKDISMSSLQNASNSKKSGISMGEDLSENIIEELPLNDDNLKYEIIKEFRRIYGNKLDKILLKNNLQNSSNVLEIILRNVRLARQKMIKVQGNNLDPDDLLTKEFMQKYSNELKYIINYYHNQEKKRNFFKQKAIRSMSKNMNLMRKMQEIENKNIENEIERRRKSRDIRNKHNQIKLCNEIYYKALELEKQKYLEERANTNELRKVENEEKRNVMLQIENYYKDKISILKDILRKEKYEKEIEYRARIQFLSKIEKEKKSGFKKQIEEMFDRFEEEERKNEFRNNTEELDNILRTYYKK